MAQSASLGVLLDHIQDKIVLLDEQGTITYNNDAIERTLGYDTDALVGESAFEYVHPDDVTQTRAVFERTIASDAYTANTTRYRFRAADDSWVWLESRMSNLTDEVLDGYVVSSRDISKWFAAKRERRETAERLGELATVAGDVLWMFNGDWSEVLFVNPAYESVYGASTDELKANPAAFLETIHPDDRPRVEEAMERLSNGTPLDIEYRVNPTAGYDTWVWVAGEPICRDGEVVRITGFSRDITERKRRNRQLYVMDKLLRHNLRNDLTTMLGQAELIEMSEPETSEQVAIIRRTGEELLASAEKQRTIIEVLTDELRVDRYDIATLIERSIEDITDRFPSASVSMEGADSAVAPVVPQFQLVVTEVVENAVRHSESESPEVTLTLTADGDSIVLDVRDSCPPIPANEVQVLLGEYEMTDLYHSTGLGLWLIHWVVDLLDGDIVVSRDEEGNHVKIRLPARRSETGPSQ